MSDIDLEVKGQAELDAAFRASPKIALPFLTQAMNRSTLAVVGYLKDEGYPPESAANRPGRFTLRGKGTVHVRPVPMGYYERHRGWWYPIMNLTKGTPLGKSRGVIRAAKKLREAQGGNGPAGYRLAKGRNGQPGNSEQLGQSWSVDVRQVGGGIEGVLGTNTSYAPWVQGATTQSGYMKMLGWITDQEALDKARPDIDAAFSEAAQQVVAALAKAAGGK